MELNVGDYVRNENGLIGKIIGFKGDMVETDNKRLITYKSNHNEIINSSPNIIDLIEVGDYVNKQRVCHIEYDENDNLQYIFTGNNYNYALNEDDIESVLTHEQFEAMQYVVGDN